MLVKCPDCKESFDLDKNEFDDGDETECPECGENLTITTENAQFKLITDKQKLHDFDEIEYEET